MNHGRTERTEQKSLTWFTSLRMMVLDEYGPLNQSREAEKGAENFL